MPAPRRLALQLTPLLDLLLIVIFGQYLEVRSQEVARAEQTQQLETRLNTTEAELQQSHELLAAAQSRQQLVGELIRELFQVPEEAIKPLLSPFSSPDLRSAEDRERLRKQFTELAAQQPEAAIQHVLTYDEIRKRCDLWDLHIDAEGTITLRVADNAAAVPILVTSEQDIDLQALSAAMFARYKDLPEQKSLVLVLFTYDPAARVQLTRAVRQTLPMITARMQSDAGGRSRYDFADLGFRRLP